MDKYINYQQLASREQEGRDYQIRSWDRGSNILIFGPHAGGIEPGTSELVTSIADQDLSCYLFEGIKAKGNGELHITSTNFDEPRALRLLKSSSKAIAFHGERGDDLTVYFGGQDETLWPHIDFFLQEAGFHTAKHDNPLLQGTSPANICNRCVSGAGLQLEISRGLRRRFFHSPGFAGRKQKTEEFYLFVHAVREGLLRANAC